jgi:glutaredoxin
MRKFDSLWSWLGPGTSLLKHLQVRVYTRRGCHLCDEAWERLEEARRRLGFGLEAVDVDSDSSLAARYGEQVPVVLVNGVVRFRGGVSGVLWNRLLRAEAERARRSPASPCADIKKKSPGQEG